MELNLGKCTFIVEEGQFLGYYVTMKGIQASLTKVDELMKVPSLHTLRDAQGFNGKLNALSRFISKSREKSMSLFYTLKECIEKSNFQWIPIVEVTL